MWKNIKAFGFASRFPPSVTTPCRFQECPRSLAPSGANGLSIGAIFARIIKIIVRQVGISNLHDSDKNHWVCDCLLFDKIHRIQYKELTS